MAADQRRKGFNGAAAEVSMREKPRGKKKPAQSTESNGFVVKPRVSLEWDASRKRVVAKREQIGLSWRNLRPFVDPQPHEHKILADAFDVHRELFKLENIGGVLSFEVWETCLDESERRFLSQFLPGETEPQQTVKQLLGGENFHFGNPFHEWAASLQSGSLHPDAIVHQEQSLKSEKNAYYVELHRYHNDMVGNLLKMKETWQSSKGLEKEFNQRTMRSKKAKEKKFSRVDESEFRDLGNSFASASKSSSLGTEDKTSNYAHRIESSKKPGDLRKRMNKKVSVQGGDFNPHFASNNVTVGTAKRRKSIKVTKKNVIHHDGTEYMSYVKISKKQHELAKSLEQSGSSMMSESLGNLESLQIQPYKVFVEEQQKKLHDHWLHLVNHDLPSAYGIWCDIHSRRKQTMRSLEQELLERHDELLEDGGGEITKNELLTREDKEGIGWTLSIEEDKEYRLSSSHDQQDEAEVDYASPMEDDEESTGPSLVSDPRADDKEMDLRFDAKIPDESGTCSDANVVMGSKADALGIVPPDEDVTSVPATSEDLFLNQVPRSSSGNHTFNHGGPDSELLQPGSAARIVSTYPGNLNGSDLIDMDRVPLSQGADMWHPASSVSSMPLTYFDAPSTGCQFNSVAEIPLPPTLSPIRGEQRAPQWMDLDSNLHGQTPHLPIDSTSFGSYSNHQDQNELLHSIFSSQQKHMGSLNFQMPNSVLNESYGQRMQTGIQQNISTSSMLPNGGGNRFQIQHRAPEHHMLPQSVSMQGWVHPVSSAIQTTPLPGQSWYNEHQIRGSEWTSTSAGPNQASNLVVDQSMYDVLPQLSSRPLSYDSMGNFIPSRGYGHGIMSGPGIESVMPHHPAPTLDYMDRRDEDTGWMSLPPHQNNSLSDSTGKPPFLGSWNQ